MLNGVLVLGLDNTLLCGVKCKQCCRSIFFEIQGIFRFDDDVATMLYITFDHILLRWMYGCWIVV